MIKRATFSPCRQYRYTLHRQWGTEWPVMFIGLNPSTATEELDDPTIRRCMGYARAWGLGGLIMTNLFAYRATDPKVMKAQAEPVGTENDDSILVAAESAAIVVAAWGAHGTHLDRGKQMRQLFDDAGVRLHYLQLTKDGHPGHPLYLKADLKPKVWK